MRPATPTMTIPVRTDERRLSRACASVPARAVRRRRALSRIVGRRMRNGPHKAAMLYYLAIGAVPRSLWDNP